MSDGIAKQIQRRKFFRMRERGLRPTETGSVIVRGARDGVAASAGLRRGILLLILGRGILRTALPLLLLLSRHVVGRVNNRTRSLIGALAGRRTTLRRIAGTGLLRIVGGGISALR